MRKAVENEETLEQLEYGNWIRRRKLILLGLFALGAGALLFIPLGSLYLSLVTILFAITLVSFLFPLYAYVMFSQKGGRLQEKIYNLIIQKLGEQATGRILDIGTGNGVLAVKLARQCDEVEVTGIDYWGEDWEYSKSVCKKNALLAKVENRVHFQKGDAAGLDFASDMFNGAISNLTFHEVRSVADKKSVVQEALRVVKRGGSFVFVDYFYEEKYYGMEGEFRKFLTDLGLLHFEYQPIRNLIALPALLRHPKILGRDGVIYGRK
jgi:SAM-dependent methyltransferase